MVKLTIDACQALLPDPMRRVMVSMMIVMAVPMKPPCRVLFPAVQVPVEPKV